MKNRVLLVLVIGGALAAWGLAFLTVAPNRLVSGTAIPLAQISDPLRDVLLLPAAVLVLGVFLPQRGRTHVAVAVAATLLLFCLAWLAGAHAARLAETAIATSRTALGGGFWLLALIAWLAAVDAIERLRLGPVAATLAHLSVLLPVIALLLRRRTRATLPAPGIRDAQGRLLRRTRPARGNRRRRAAADAARRHSARHCALSPREIAGARLRRAQRHSDRAVDRAVRSADGAARAARSRSSRVCETSGSAASAWRPR